MPAQSHHLSSILLSFSTFLENVLVTSKIGDEALVLFAEFLAQKRNLQNWNSTELESFALSPRSGTQSFSPGAIGLVSDFITRFPPFQANVFLHEFILALRAEGCSDSTLKNYRSDINQFIQFTAEYELYRLLSKPKVVDFLRSEAEKGLKQASIRRKLVSLSQFILWAEKQGLIERAAGWVTDLNQQLDQLTSTSGIAPTHTHTGKTNVPHSHAAIWSLPVATPLSPKNLQKTAAQRSARGRQDYRARIQSSLSSLSHRLTQETRQHFLPYLNLFMITLFFLGAGYLGWRQFGQEADAPFAFPTTLNRPNRTLSFQGRLTDTAQNPIITSTNLRFRLFDTGPGTGGTELWDSDVCAITPDQDGIFSTGLGDDCGAEISADVFTENTNVWLEVTVAAETLTPRQQIKTVAYALNSETLQGFPASASAVENTVLIMDNAGEIVLGNANPVLKATGDTFAIEAETLTLRTSTGSNGNIIFDPDGTGITQVLSDLVTTGYISAPGATLSATYAGGTALTLKAGPTATADIMRWQTSAGSTLGVINSAGNLGIGSTNPTVQLLVAGSGAQTIRVDSSSAGADVVVNSATNTDSRFILAENNINKWFLTSDGDSSDRLILSGDGGLGSDDFLTIAQTGNVGIGTTNPLEKFHLSDNYGIMRFGDNNSATGTSQAGLEFFSDFASTRLGRVGFFGDGNLLLSNDHTTRDIFIMPSAARNVGVGTTTPAAKLDVSGTFRVSGTTTFGGLTYTWPGSQGASQFLQTNGSGGLSWADVNSVGYWDLQNGALYPKNSTTDLLIGGTATSSAKFAFINTNSGTPTASISGNLALSAPTGSNPTTSLNILNGGTLNIRTSTGGDAGLSSRLFVSNSGNIGIGDETPSYTLETTGTGYFSGALSLGTQATTTSHAVRADRSISTGNGLSGGGNLTADRTLSVNAPTCGGTDKLQWNGTAFVCSTDVDTNTSAFTGLTDTPSSYSGNALYLVRVNAGQTALEFVDPSIVGTNYWQKVAGILSPALGEPVAATTSATTVATFTATGTNNAARFGGTTNFLSATSNGSLSYVGMTARTITGPETGGLTMTVPAGPLTLSTTTSGTLAVTSAGALNLTGAAASTWSLGTGNALTLTSQNFRVASGGNITVTAGQGLDVIAAGALNLGNTTATTVSIGDTAATTLNLGAGGALTRAISIGTGTGADTINIGTGATGADIISIGGTGANTIALGNTQTAGSISLGAAMTSGSINIGGTGAQTGAINVGVGTGAQAINLGTGGTGVKTVNIGTGAVANVIGIGTTTGAATTTIHAGTGHLRLVPTGSENNVGIGNTDPSAKLDVNGQVRVRTLTGTATSALCYDGNNILTPCAASSSLTGAGVANYLARWTSATNLSTGITYDNGSSVGIGTTTPATIFNVGGTTNKSISVDSESNRAYYGAFNDAAVLGINRDPSTAAFFSTGKAASYIAMSGGAANGYIDFFATNTNNTNPPVIMRVAGNGNVGIGTTNPGSKLTLAEGTTAVQGIGFGTDTNLYRSAANRLNTDDGFQAVDYYSGDGTQGATNTVGGLVFKDGLYTSGSLSLSGIDHGTLSGLGDDDHTQYALLAGRSGGQTLIGGTGTTDNLVLRTTAGVGASGANMIFQVGNNGTTEAMRILNNGNVGIGTTNPSSAKLQVVGAGNFSSTLTAATDETINGIDINAGAISDVTDLSLNTGGQVTFATETGDKAYWYSNTYGTGVEGSTLTNWSASTFRWRVGGSSVSTGTSELELTASALYPATNGGLNLGTSSLRFGTAYVNDLCFDGGSDCVTSTNAISGPWTLSGNDLYPDSTSYNIAIGTTAANKKLFISSSENNATIGAANTSALRIANTYTAAFGRYSEISFTTGTSDSDRLAGIAAEYTNWDVTNGVGGKLHFWTKQATVATPVTRMAIDQTGNVGIGTTDPLQKLDVAGTIRSNGTFRVTGSTAQYLTDGAQAVTGKFLGIQVSSSYSGTIPSNGILFGTDSTLYMDAATSLRSNSSLRIDNNLTIGSSSSTAPGSRLSVRGSQTDGRLTIDTDGPLVQIAQTSWSGSAAILFSAYASSSYVDGGITQTGNTKYAYSASAFGSSSHRAKAISVNHNSINFNISNDSTGAGNDVAWNTPMTVTVDGITQNGNAVCDISGNCGQAGMPSGSSGQTLRHNGTSWLANSTIFNNGTNVGIGTTAPAQKLHLEGDYHFNLSGGGQTRSGAFGSSNQVSGDSTDKWVKLGQARIQGNYAGATLVLNILPNDPNHGNRQQTINVHLRNNGASTPYKFNTRLINNDSSPCPLFKDIKLVHTVVNSPAGNHEFAVWVQLGCSWLGNDNPVTVHYLGNWLALNIDSGATRTQYASIQDAGTQYSKEDYAFGSNSVEGNWNVSGSVGIGTTAPGANLDVVASSGYGTLHLDGASGAIMRFNTAGVNKWGLLTEHAGANKFGLYDYGSSVYRLVAQNDGNIGIGSTSPLKRLHIESGTASDGILIDNSLATSYGTINFRNSSDATPSRIHSFNPTWTSSGSWQANGLAIANNLQGVTLVADGGSGVLRFFTAGIAAANERMRVTANGNIGIGTTSPATIFNVGGTTNKSISVDSESNRAYYGAFNDAAVLGVNRDPATGSFFSTSKAASYIAMSGGATNGYIDFFATNTNNINPPVIMRVAGNGNVGIGTTAPGAKLDVFDVPSQGTNPSSGGGNLVLSTSANRAEGVGGTIMFKNSSNTASAGPTWTMAKIMGVADNSSNGNAAGRLVLGVRGNYTGSAWPWIDAMTIRATGNVGIGTTAPTAKLQVVSTTNLTGVSTQLTSSDTSASSVTGLVTSLSHTAAITSGNKTFYGDYVSAIRTTPTDTSTGAISAYGTYVIAQQATLGNFGTRYTYGGSFNATGNANGASTVVGLEALAQGGDANYGLVVAANPGLAIYATAGDSAFNDNVGIGTTAPLSKLDVSGYLSFSPTSYGSFVKTGTEGIVLNNSNDIEWLGSASSLGYGHRLYSADPGGLTHLRLARRNNSGSWTDMATFTSTGNVGIGTTTVDSLLDVEGTIFATGYGRDAHHEGHLVGSYNSVGDNASKSNPIYTIGSNYNPSDAALGNMYGIGYSHDNFWFDTLGVGRSDAGWGMYVASDGDIRATISGANGDIWSAGEMYLAGSGNNYFGGKVGIGSTNPDRELAIEKNTNAGVGAYIENTNVGTSASTTLELRNGGSFNDSVRLLALGTGFTTNNMYIADSGLLVSEVNLSNGLSIAARAANAPIRFYAGSDTPERMRIKGDGNVGIGITNPGYKLQVDGDAAKNTGASWTTISDSRLKENIQDFTDGLDVLTRIRPVSYELNGLSGTTKGEKGISIIAQEMLELAPYTIGTFAGIDAAGQPTEYFDYDASAVTYIIINAVQEQQLQIASNSATIAALDTRTNSLAFSSDGDLTITGATGEYTVTPTTTGASPLQTIGGFARVVAGNIRAGLVSTRELVVTQTANISSLSVETMTVGGQTLRSYIEDVVMSLPVTNTANNSENSSETALLSPIVELESLTAESASISGTLTAETALTGELRAVELEVTGATKLSTLLADSASVAGELTTETITTGSLTAETVTTDDFSATTGRLAQLEAGMAQLEEVRAQVAELSDLTTNNLTAVDATISGTLYANSIDNLDQHVAAALRQPTLLELLLNQSPSAVAPPSETIEIIESAGYEATNSAALNLTLADLQLQSDAIVLETTAQFVSQYLEVNGTAFVQGQLGVGNQVAIGDGLLLSSGTIAYEPNLENPGETLFEIQPSGRGTLSLLAGLMTLSENGQVSISGNLAVAGDIKTEGTLLANLLRPTDFGSPFQVQVAGAASESGQATESRFEIVNETQTPVATISAQGRADFSAGLGIAADDLRAQTPTGTTITSDKTAGKATIPAGTSEVVILASALNPETLIYVTPLGSTQNQTLYVKSQIPDEQSTPENEASFTVGFDLATTQAVEFNWWLVN